MPLNKETKPRKEKENDFDCYNKDMLGFFFFFFVIFHFIVSLLFLQKMVIFFTVEKMF